ncbi:hypothetical protein BCR39DRAFT_348690 [Naematelia encephala]|uniref:Uncharacterized protein n=1 Tax=Naematelia encephala TaxID=71784 RepID=A0A1Y2AM47_9TREE|nr:hypothetical protein BCR39DRAFT_348690 [Naematelia encephala]
MGRWVVNGGYYGAPVKPLTQARLGHSKLAMPGVARGWTGVQDARRPPVGWPVVPGRLPNHLGFPAHPFIADHLFHLRNGIFANWYNPSTMSLLTTLLLSCVLALVLIVLVGKLIGSGYDTDIAMRVSSSSSSSSSTSTSTSSSSSTSDIIQREIAKRQNEKPEETLKRVQAEKRIARLDSKSRATLVQYLERKGLNLAGLDDSEAEPKGDETKDDESKKSDEVKPAKTLQRLQRKLLGKGLYNGLQKKKQETTAAGGATTDRASLQTPGHVVEVTAQAQNTTDIANKLRVDMAST